MHDWVSFNNNIVKSSEARIQAVSNAGLYGKGVFTTIAIHGGLPFLFDKHWRRLEDNSGKLGISISCLTKESLFSRIIELIDRNAADDAKCRVTIFDGDEPELWSNNRGCGAQVLVQTGKRTPNESPLSLCISPFPITTRSPLNNIKSCNYLERILAKENALDSGFDEALRINEKGGIVSASMANLFWLKDSRLFTPDVGTGCLEGTTRAYVTERWKTVSVTAELETLYSADSVFLTSAGFGIAGVGEILFETERVKYKNLEKEELAEYDLDRLF